MRVKVNHVDKNHVDTCHISNSIAIAGDEKENHKGDANKVRQVIKSDKDFFSFHLQKAHTIPVLNASTAYYKHQLTLYNEGIHDRTNNQSYSHLWRGNTGRRKSSEIVSILHAFATNHCKTLNELTFWCDNCGAKTKISI